MALELAEIVIESADPEAAARFWAEALGWERRTHQPGDVPWVSASGDGESHDLKLVFVPARQGRPAASRMYLRAEPGGTTVDDLCARGAERPARQTPERTWTTLVDPGGTEFAVLSDAP
jgi:hypothetical protein